jgi:4-hydroxy-tetrahydrodipicolinate reductase
MAITLVISGCSGRMGRSIASLALQDAAFTIGGALEAAGHQAVGRDLGAVLGRSGELGVRVSDDAKAALGRGDVLIEFTLPEPTVAHVRLAQQLRKSAVIGTTGLSDAEQGVIREAAKAIPIVFSPNMSVGVNLLFELAQLAAQRLGPGYDVEVVEAHHRQKKDSPSGTAKRLAQALAEARRQDPASIPVHAVRAGDIIGDHTVILAGPSERLELTHRAQSRDVFALGALRAARFVAGRPPGLYDMSHVIKAA